MQRVRYSRAFWALCIGRLSNQVGAFTLTFLTLLMTQRGHLSVPQAGITVPGYGFVLNDRGALFSLDPHSPNLIAPAKRPFHTPLPGFVMKEGRPLTAFGLMGGAQQAQGHVQVLIDMIDFGANPQEEAELENIRQPMKDIRERCHWTPLLGAAGAA